MGQYVRIPRTAVEYLLINFCMRKIQIKKIKKWNVCISLFCMEHSFSIQYTYIWFFYIFANCCSCCYNQKLFFWFNGVRSCVGVCQNASLPLALKLMGHFHRNFAHKEPKMKKKNRSWTFLVVYLLKQITFHFVWHKNFCIFIFIIRRMIWMG